MEDAEITCLVDFDNARPLGKIQDADHAADLLHIIIERLVEIAKEQPRPPPELRIRLYGGWTYKNDELSRVAQWLYRHLSEFRGIRSRIRVMPTLATTMIALPERRIVGTYRPNDGQKMVDMMLSMDLLHIACVEGQAVWLVADDEDYLPAIACCAAGAFGRASFAVLRHRSAGKCVNDQWLNQLGVKITELRTRNS